MNALMIAEKTMSSREIAELTGKEHRNVMRDARQMLAELYGEGGVLRFEHTYTNPQNGQTYPEYLLSFELVQTLITGYSIKLRHAVIQRLNELEANQRAFDPMKALADPATMRGLLLTYSEKVLALEAENQSMQADVNALNRIAKAENSLCLTDAAKALGTTRNRLIKYLSMKGWIYKRHGGGVWLGYSDKEKQGLVEHKLTEYPSGDSVKISEQVRIMPKGMVKLAKMLAEGEAA